MFLFAPVQKSVSIVKMLAGFIRLSIWLNALCVLSIKLPACVLEPFPDNGSRYSWRTGSIRYFHQHFHTLRILVLLTVFQCFAKLITLQPLQKTNAFCVVLKPNLEDVSSSMHHRLLAANNFPFNCMKSHTFSGKGQRLCIFMANIWIPTALSDYFASLSKSLVLSDVCVDELRIL